MHLDPLTLKLAKISLGGAVATIGFGWFVKKKLKSSYEELVVYKEAVELLTSNRHIKQYLGEPIRIFGVDLADRHTIVNEDDCKLSVIAIGSISRGTMYLEAMKDTGDPPKAVLKSVEFELDKPRGRIKLL